MAYNKIVYGGKTLLDLTGDTVEASKMLSGYTAHDKSGAIITGTCTFDVNSQDATASLGEVLATKTFYARGQKYTGTMPNNGKVTGTISDLTTTFPIAQGYHDGSGSVGIASAEIAKIKAENIREGVSILGVLGTMSGSESEKPETLSTIIPSTVEQYFSPSEGFTCFTEFTVAAIPYVESQNSAGGITVTIA